MKTKMLLVCKINEKEIAKMEQQYSEIKKLFITVLSFLSVRKPSNVHLGRWHLLIRGDNGPMTDM